MPCANLLEVGPGTGVLTKYLLKRLSAVSYQPSAEVPEKATAPPQLRTHNSQLTTQNSEPGTLNQEQRTKNKTCPDLSGEQRTKPVPIYRENKDLSRFLALDVDRESIAYLKQTYPQHSASFIEADFLKINPEQYFDGCLTVIGNFPYNISSQIFFKILDHVDLIPEIVCMLQKEVAERIASPPGNKAYGILSVLLQAWYRIEYLFTVNEHVFIPPPKVKSAVIRLTRNETTDLGCDPKAFKNIIKTAFNQRRENIEECAEVIQFQSITQIRIIIDQRAEQLGVEDYIFLTQSALF